MKLYSDNYLLRLNEELAHLRLLHLADSSGFHGDADDGQIAGFFVRLSGRGGDAGSSGLPGRISIAAE